MTKSDANIAMHTFIKVMRINSQAYERNVRNSRDFYTKYHEIPFWNYSVHFRQWYHTQYKSAVMNAMLDCGLAVDQEGVIGKVTINKVWERLNQYTESIITKQPFQKLERIIVKEVEMQIEAQAENLIKNLQNIL